MTVVTATSAPGALPYGRPLTRTDLEALPDDGHRYELVDGVLLVSPSPRPRHQRALGRLHLLLARGLPAGLELLFAPTAVALAEDTELQPDLLIAPVSQFTERELVGAPLLAVEVLSPSTRRVDLLLKRDRLQEAGCPSYWLVDPDVPSVVVLELRDGAYVEVARAQGDEEVEVLRPYAVRLRPSALVATC